VSRVFCRFQVADLQFAEQMGEGVLPGSSVDGMERGLIPFLPCDVARKVFCPIFPSGFGQCV